MAEIARYVTDSQAPRGILRIGETAAGDRKTHALAPGGVLGVERLGRDRLVVVERVEQVATAGRQAQVERDRVAMGGERLGEAPGFLEQDAQIVVEMRHGRRDGDR